ncbi:hypothetical protein [Aliamphritea spongicola]|nr:hypothetical protein [Aliamphritea spongicola]
MDETIDKIEGLIIQWQTQSVIKLNETSLEKQRDHSHFSTHTSEPIFLSSPNYWTHYLNPSYPVLMMAPVPPKTALIRPTGQ